MISQEVKSHDSLPQTELGIHSLRQMLPEHSGIEHTLFLPSRRPQTNSPQDKAGGTRKGVSAEEGPLKAAEAGVITILFAPIGKQAEIVGNLPKVTQLFSNRT